MGARRRHLAGMPPGRLHPPPHAGPMGVGHARRRLGRPPPGLRRRPNLLETRRRPRRRRGRGRRPGCDPPVRGGHGLGA
eukprot:11189926-Lingulodinium_polyedra.AAC.1